MSEKSAAHTPRRKERFGLALLVLFLHHNTLRNRRKRCSQSLAVAVGLVVAPARRLFRNSLRIEIMLREIGLDHPRANHRTHLMPGIPSHRQIVPALGALGRQDLVDVVPHMCQPARFIKTELLIVVEQNHIRPVRSLYSRSSLIKISRRNRKMRRPPGPGLLLRLGFRRGYCSKQE